LVRLRLPALLLTAAACGNTADSGASAGAGRGSAPIWSASERDGAGELRLSQTGLYANISHKVLATDLHAFEPAFALWSDGAEKRRWLRLPAGARIDNTHADHWSFPVGSVLFKEFSRAGQRIETRVIARTGSGPRDYWMGAFVWDEDESDARFAPEGLVNARGTRHDVPSARSCGTCHNGERGRMLGFSAIQQPHAPKGLLLAPSERPAVPPGNAATRAALGYLHANCAHCHNPSGSAYPDVDLDLRLSSLDLTPEETRTYRTTVSKPLQFFRGDPRGVRLVPGAADQSAIVFRMSQRDPKLRMPPLASEEPDEHGIADIRAWIDSL
jgi:hypothetical protein